mmetsp:Transcript_17357/g.20137  ORF Transcript_17357/g.20137 Transcript_17357/m.20137 type:complete len:134 (+) Transcript_17357:1713-2114(+)
MYFGDEVQKLKDQGAKIYSFDLKQNSVPNAFSTHKKLNQSANISRMRNKGAHGKNLNRSVIGRIGTSKIEEDAVIPTILPNIMQKANRRNISQIRKDEGEYSRMLANRNNNRLVQAQKTIDDALRKQRTNNPK